MSFPSRVIPFARPAPAPAAIEQRWREAGHAYLAACFTGASGSTLQRLAEQFALAAEAKNLVRT